MHTQTKRMFGSIDSLKAKQRKRVILNGYCGKKMPILKEFQLIAYLSLKNVCMRETEKHLITRYERIILKENQLRQIRNFFVN